MRFVFYRLAVACLSAVTLLSACTREESSDALIKSAKTYMAKYDTNAAIIQLKNVLQKEPNHPEARFLLGTASLQNGDAVTAEKELRRARELKYPDDQVIPPLARSLAALGQYKKLLDEFGGVQLPTPGGKAQLQTAIGQAHFALGNRNAAATAFAEALRDDPSYTAASLGQAKLAVG